MIYLNYAALCPTRPEAEQEVVSTLTEFKQYLYSDAGIRWYERKVDTCRQQVAKLLNVVDPSKIAFVPNASMAFHLTVSLVDWNHGDIILTSTHENPSIRRELQELTHRGVEIQYLKTTTPRELIDSIDRISLKQPLKAITLSHISHVDGRIFPIQEVGALARERNILFIVDGAQAVGHIPVDLNSLAFDFYFFPGHKWCCGPLGTGTVVMHEHALRINPSFGSDPLQQLKTPARRFEIGTHNIGLIAGLAKACEIKQQEGFGTDYLRKLRKEARIELRNANNLFHIQEWDGPQGPGILTFRCPSYDDHDQVLKHLEASANIVVKSFHDYPENECPAIRLSWIANTSEQDVDYAIKKIGEPYQR